MIHACVEIVWQNLQTATDIAKHHGNEAIVNIIEAGDNLEVPGESGPLPDKVAHWNVNHVYRFVKELDTDLGRFARILRSENVNGKLE